MNNQGLIYTRFPFSSIENMVLPGNLTDQETQLIHSLRVDVEKFNAIEWGKDIWDQQKSSSNNIFSRSLRENLNEVESFLVFAASSPCLPHIGLGVVNIKFNNILLHSWLSRNQWKRLFQSSLISIGFAVRWIPAFWGIIVCLNALCIPL